MPCAEEPNHASARWDRGPPADQDLRAKHGGAALAEAKCLVCHTPHASKSAGLISARAHPGFAEKDCSSCHAAGRPPGPKTTHAPVAQLCARCHAVSKPQTATATVHPPVKLGACLTCHTPPCLAAPGPPAGRGAAAVQHLPLGRREGGRDAARASARGPGRVRAMPRAPSVRDRGAAEEEGEGAVRRMPCRPGAPDRGRKAARPGGHGHVPHLPRGPRVRARRHDAPGGRGAVHALPLDRAARPRGEARRVLARPRRLRRLSRSARGLPRPEDPAQGALACALRPGEVRRVPRREAHRGDGRIGARPLLPLPRAPAGLAVGRGRPRPLQSRESCLSCHGAHTAGSTALLDRPDEQLCFTCHDRKGFQRENVHGALQNGCTTCHNPHAAAHPKLLHDAVNAACRQCHGDTSKHFQKVESIDDPRTGRPITCVGCHLPHSSDEKALLSHEPTRELCIQCHDPSMGAARK